MTLRRSPVHLTLAALGALAVLAVLALVTLLYTMRQHGWAMALLALLGVAAWVYTSPRLYAWRYVVPGVFAALVFIVFPMTYTLAISFTNYSSENLLSFERSTEVLLGRTDTSGTPYSLRVQATALGHRLWLVAEDGTSYASEPFKPGDKAQRIELTPQPADEAMEALPLKELIALQPALKQVTARMPDGSELHSTGLRSFAASRPTYVRNADGTLTRSEDGAVLRANFDSGFWELEGGSRVEPGFRTEVGWRNYVRIFTDQRFFEPFARVFGWTVTFASLNTLITFAIGVTLAVALNWDALKGRNFYRVMLFLPYAVPAFISIPVFRGLFNENLGEINLILDHLFGIRPGWFSDATLARGMVLAVNAWLGYPYMMILAMGLIKAIPSDLYEASALAGAGPATNFFRITLPLIARPIAPLLITSFAFNFNNLTLIALLTAGAPDFLDTQVPVGATDLLASYTYRIAFQDSGQNYALACAISSIVFLIVATLAVVNLKVFKVGKE